MDGSTISVKAGALIAYTDNTGAPYESSGDHLHFGLIPTQPNFNPIDPYNGFGGCIDPLPFFNGLFAQDIPIDQQVLSAASKVISLSQNPAFPTSLTLQIIQKVEDFLNQLFTFIQ
jgi:murein DD-endopeptidase MepM/ murein hydrolase activator NlpD